METKSTVPRYYAVKLLTQAGSSITWTPQGPEVVLAEAYDAIEAENYALEDQVKGLQELGTTLLPPAGNVEGLPGRCPEKTLGPNPFKTNYAVGWDDCLAKCIPVVTRLQARADKNWRALIDMRDERDKALEELRLEKLIKASTVGEVTQVESCNRPGGCVCGGDVPAVRRGCSHFETIPHRVLG